jgi:hypothetical protein
MDVIFLKVSRRAAHPPLKLSQAPCYQAEVAQLSSTLFTRHSYALAAVLAVTGTVYLFKLFLPQLRWRGGSGGRAN